MCFQISPALSKVLMTNKKRNAPKFSSNKRFPGIHWLYRGYKANFMYNSSSTCINPRRIHCAEYESEMREGLNSSRGRRTCNEKKRLFLQCVYVRREYRKYMKPSLSRTCAMYTKTSTTNKYRRSLVAQVYRAVSFFP